MPSKRRKYNARFPARLFRNAQQNKCNEEEEFSLCRKKGRIKKIMQTDEEVGKVAQAVPIIISRTLELFVESLLRQTLKITMAKNAKTLSPSHMKQCIISESRFDFLKDLVKSLPDVNTYDDDGGGTVCNSEGETIENSAAVPNSSDPSLSSLSGFPGPRHSGQIDTKKSNIPHKKARIKEETDSEDSESVDTDKADVGTDSDFVIDEEYEA